MPQQKLKCLYGEWNKEPTMVELPIKAIPGSSEPDRMIHICKVYFMYFGPWNVLAFFVQEVFLISWLSPVFSNT